MTKETCKKLAVAGIWIVVLGGGGHLGWTVYQYHTKLYIWALPLSYRLAMVAALWGLVLLIGAVGYHILQKKLR